MLHSKKAENAQALTKTAYVCKVHHPEKIHDQGSIPTDLTQAPCRYAQQPKFERRQSDKSGDTES